MAIGTAVSTVLKKIPNGAATLFQETPLSNRIAQRLFKWRRRRM
ncbi:hypothetical protein N8I74_09840 [Chitiniphilus purpureus]|uniref:Uncharacterized protein n=1 Tax=Chitiniphilus purpureus TaxID=2981137 RepID=A0ABY6DIV8_9NEIS|nr:hypothetical protein [Chitiniphilus sp. CD1]UXY13628.1 hypothetical protein N8I74_09840 [Chitiniphilus sp. CD1]